MKIGAVTGGSMPDTMTEARAEIDQIDERFGLSIPPTVTPPPRRPSQRSVLISALAALSVALVVVAVGLAVVLPATPAEHVESAVVAHVGRLSFEQTYTVDVTAMNDHTVWFLYSGSECSTSWHLSGRFAVASWSQRDVGCTDQVTFMKMIMGGPPRRDGCNALFENCPNR